MFACPKAKDATAFPVVGEIVSVPSLFTIDVTPAISEAIRACTNAVVAIVVLFVAPDWVVAVDEPRANALANVGVPENAILPLNVGAPVNVPENAAPSIVVAAKVAQVNVPVNVGAAVMATTPPVPD